MLLLCCCCILLMLLNHRSVMQLINTLMHQSNSLITQNWLLSPFLERSVTHGIPHLMFWTNARRRARENEQNQPRKWKTNTNWKCTFDHSLCLLLLYVVCSMYYMWHISFEYFWTFVTNRKHNETSSNWKAFMNSTKLATFQPNIYIW